MIKLQMKIVDIKKNNSLELAAEVLNSGGILVFPTDTVYGIGCALSDVAIKKLYKIKNRPENQPTAVLMSRNLFDAKRTEVLEFDYDLENNFYAGVLTIVDKVENYAIKFPEMITENGTIGVRMPQHPWLEALIDQVGPIVASSANKKGEPAPAKFSQISEVIKKEADLVIESSQEMIGQPSAIYNLSTHEKLR